MTTYEELRRPSDRLSLRRWLGLWWRAITIVREAAPVEAAVVTVVQLTAGLALVGQLALAGRALQLLTRSDDIDLSAVAPTLAAASVVMVLSSLLSVASQELSLIIHEKVARVAHGRVLDVAVAVDLEAYDTPGFHDRLVRAQAQIEEQSWQVVHAAVRVMTGLVGLAAVGVVLTRVAPVVSLVMLTTAVPLWVTTRRNSQQLYELAFDRTPLERERAYLQRLLTSRREAAELRVFGLGDHLRGRYDSLYRRRLAAVVRTGRKRLLRSVSAGAVTAAIGAGGLILLAAMVADGRLDLPDAGVAVLALSQVQARLTSLIVGASFLHTAGRFLDDYVSFTDLATPGRPPGASRRRETFQTLRLENLSFTYPGTTHRVLHDVNLEVHRGEVVALVGENGSGKTTLAKLLCGLYRPTSGAVLWDDVRLDSRDGEGLDPGVAAVFQDYATFQLSARDNVGLGDHSRLDDTVGQQRAAEQAGIAALLQQLPAGWDTRLSREYEGGVELSVGQWQRVALARAFFRDAPFLVLDEPTAALDPRAEAELFASLAALHAGRTALLISHRFSSVRSADRIYVLHKGRVVEQGTHDELMARGGHYAELFTLQARAYLNPDPAATSRST